MIMMEVVIGRDQDAKFMAIARLLSSTVVSIVDFSISSEPSTTYPST